MLPTTYRGDATIDGERMDAQLKLDDDRVRLVTGRHAELVSWPLHTVGVEPRREGGYLLKAGSDSFEFSPFVDDGLGDEIALRSRFAGVTGLTPPEPEPVTATVADRARGGRNHRRTGVLAGGDLALRTALVVLGILALVVVTVALVSGAFENEAGPVVVGPEALSDTETPPATLPFTEPTAAPIPDATTGPSAAPTTTPSVNSTSQNPATTTPPPPTTAASPTTPTTVGPDTGPSVPGLDLTREQFVDRWNSVSNELGGVLGAEGVTNDDSSLRFFAGDWVEMQAQIGPDGTVDSIRMLGDPSGSRADDRMVITAMGMVAAVAAPDLEPLGRRAMLEELGFDFDAPDLAGLDNSLTYQDAEYRLRWDPDLIRIVFEVAPIGA